ncbi:hypothetical protein BT69DRAFT_165426 [Atractiella rhizophila]|nr:hypothetical protein BT69DRAFT_165426 [Atractiella rhizophila]
MVMEHIFHEDESFSSHQIVSSGENLRRVSGEEVHKRKRNRQVLSWQECKRFVLISSLFDITSSQSSYFSDGK